MTIDEMKQRKKELGYSNAKLSKLSGVPVGTLQKIFSGETAAPRYDTIQALTRVLADTRFDHVTDATSVVADAAPAFKTAEYTYEIDNRADHTIDEYLALPDSVRVELIDGKFYNMAAPTTIHQSIAMKLVTLLSIHIDAHNGSCVPFIAPTDVQIDQDDRTMVQPDVFVVCDRDKITTARIVGAPDFVIEIVSPSNTMTDVMIKTIKYKMAGVKEYWIVFPEEKGIMVYNFMESDLPSHYTFEDKVPVSIWDGACEIDFAKIYEQISFLYETT